MGGYGYGGGMPYAGMYGGATVDMDPRCPTMFSQCYLPVGNFSTTISYKVIQQNVSILCPMTCLRSFG